MWCFLIISDTGIIGLVRDVIKNILKKVKDYIAPIFMAGDRGLQGLSQQMLWLFVLGAIIQCSVEPRGLDALGASHSAPGAVRVVALWEPATVAC